MVVMTQSCLTAANGLSVGLHISDDDGQGADGAVNTVSVGYTMGAMTFHMQLTIRLHKIMMCSDIHNGRYVLSAGSDEIESHYVGITTQLVAVFDSTLRSRRQHSG